ARDTEDRLAATLKGLFDLAGVPFRIDEAICASVVPSMNDALRMLCSKWFGVTLRKLNGGDSVGLNVDYQPPHAVGADRIANALGALSKYEPPLIVVDFGPATTFDTIDRRRTYVGGAILPGVTVASRALGE